MPPVPFGPFLLEKKIGAGAMGTVWRATFAKKNMRVAIKIMMPGLSDDNATAVARFQREADILKQLRHPNIVGLVGVGKYKGQRYYAMEYIEGESLDRKMERCDRMSWAEVAGLGKQLCAALQHAHEHGVIHRDLKPSNLMVVPDGTLKLTDFGIAKDLDVTQLTEANCTVGTASYMSPEQCRGERNLTAKSDLYSLGIVFYELVTGDKPFKADNAMEMFMHHVKTKPVRPGNRVLDLPVWFDTLICQLMEKKPEHRPMDAAMVAGVLSTIEEKVQTLKSAGVEVATRKRGDRPRNAPARSAEDTEAVRTLTGKGKRKVPKARFYQRWWFVATAVLALLGTIAAVLILALWLWPRSSVDKLYARAKPIMEESKDPDTDWPKALDADHDGPLYAFERYHADEKGEHADQMRRWIALVRQRECDKLVRKYLRNKKKGLPFEAHGEVQENAFAAGLDEEDGDLKSAAEHWTKVKELSRTGDGWFTLAEARLQQLADLDRAQQVLEQHLTDLKELDYKPALSEPQLELAQALRYQKFDDTFRAYQQYEMLRDKYAKDPGQRFWYLLATQKARELKPPPGESDNPEARGKRIKNRLADAQAWLQMERYADARLRFLDIVALYGGEKDEDIKSYVATAREGLDIVAQKLKVN